jgi:hypothetical protein
VVYHFDALTGADVIGDSPVRGVINGVDILPAALVESYLLDTGKERIVVFIDEYQQVRQDERSYSIRFLILLIELRYIFTQIQRKLS